MKREPVESDSIAAIGYSGSDAILEVEFNNGGIYQYLAVPEEIHAALMAAESKGRYLAKEVKPNFKYIKLK